MRAPRASNRPAAAPATEAATAGARTPGAESRAEWLDARGLERTPSRVVLTRLAATLHGLSEADAASRRARGGPNALEEERAHPLRKLLLYFWGPIPWMIEAAALLAALVGEWPELGIILALLLVNAGIGFWEEHKADDAIAMLQRRLAPVARVLREGRWLSRPARELVPGDVVHVRLGDVVPADLKLLQGEFLEVDQSALTGESLPVEKHAEDVAYSGSVVQRGEMDGLVVATGMHSYFGRTAGLVERAATPSHYQRAVLRVGHFLILLAVGLVGVVLLVALFRETPFLEALQFALVLTVASIPVALPAVLSVAMAVGAMRLARQQAIVSRLVSIEEIAGMSVLCCDKTGTLTRNQLELAAPVPIAEVGEREIVQCAALASRDADRDPIERAISAWLSREGAPLGRFEVERFEPFDPVRKHSNAVVRQDGRLFEVAKGAPQAILALCGGDADLATRVRRSTETLAIRGYRTLGVARRASSAEPWRYLGVLPFSDPPRDDSAETLRQARAMGVHVEMVTGDHAAIAREVAHALAFEGPIVSAEDAFPRGQPLDERAVERAAGFAQVFPEHKFAIVEALQRLGNIVGMTGDGVNDAPALKKADVGIAVAGATDAARSAADLVLTAPGLSVIVEAVRESRRIFERMTSYAIYRIAETIRVLLFMTLSILIFDFYPVTAVMIILLALLNDGPIMMIAYDHAKVAPRPVRWQMQQVLALATTLGVAGVFASFGMFWLGERVLGLDRPTVQTLMFLKLAVAGHLTIYLTRTIDRPFWQRPWPAPALFWSAELTQAAATLFAVYGWFMHPIGWRLAGLVWGYALAWFLVNEVIKRSAWRLLSHGWRDESAHLARIHARMTGPLPPTRVDG